MVNLDKFKLFDSHCHIIDKRFPLVENQGYLPDYFSIADYQHRTQHYNVCGGAIVSGSFQAFDQTYLLTALQQLRQITPNFVGVTQLPPKVTDQRLVELNAAGVRALRFNLKRGGYADISSLQHFAARVYDVVGWHVELYIDTNDLPQLHQTLASLPAVSIDHLGLSKSGFSHLLALVEQGAMVKATGFGRVDFEVTAALQQICAVNPAALMFGTDLPSTRAARAYADEDFLLVIAALGDVLAQQVFYANAINFYKP
ncbi:MAG: amidohydrolase family protein [Desulfuromonas sp.]|jgi:predicted TIM-barrel fold metal-dependent hydrolase|nr:amidohydrolase family protein [Desulfuromonas sp.]